MKKVWIIVSLTLILCLAACADNLNDDTTAIVAQANSFNYDIEYGETYEIEFHYFTTLTEAAILRDEITTSKITNGNDEMEVQILDDEIAWDTRTKKDGKEVYAGRFLMEIRPNEYKEIKNANLIIEYSDGTQFKSYLGDFAFCIDETKENDECLPYMNIAVMMAVPSSNAYGGLSVNAVIIECDVLEEVDLIQIDFGLSSIGIDGDRVKCFTGADINNVEAHIDEHSLDKIISNAYNKIIQKSNTSCHVHLSQGRNCIFVPLTYESDETPQVSRLFSTLQLHSKDKDVSYTIFSNKLYTIFSYEPGEIEEIMGSVDKEGM